MRPTAPQSPNHLPARHDDNWLCVVEACQGSRNKFKYEEDFSAFMLHAVLPAGTSFPYDFGFIPSTLGDDGDPLDVVVLMDEAAPVGTVVACRLVGVIEAEQHNDEHQPAIRNDRLFGVALQSRRYRHCLRLADIAPEELEEIQRFFVFYNAEKGVDFRPLGHGDPARAEALADAGVRRFRQRESQQD